ARLNQGLEGSEITKANLLIASANNFHSALDIGQQVVGHYSTGEMLEIRHPRLKDDQNALHNYVEGIYSARDQYTSEFEKQKSDRERSETELLSLLDYQPDLQVEFQRVMQASQTYMA